MNDKLPAKAAKITSLENLYAYGTTTKLHLIIAILQVQSHIATMWPQMLNIFALSSGSSHDGLQQKLQNIWGHWGGFNKMSYRAKLLHLGLWIRVAVTISVMC